MIIGALMILSALSLASLTDNRTVLFQRHLGGRQKAAPRHLRFWLGVTAGGLRHPAGKPTVKLAVPKRERAWWRRLGGKVLMVHYFEILFPVLTVGLRELNDRNWRGWFRR
jgi:hypothetical protein